MNYLVSYTLDHSRTLHYFKFTAKPNATWRELQEEFDPNYRYCNLRFYPLGNEIVYNE